MFTSWVQRFLCSPLPRLLIRRNPGASINISPSIPGSITHVSGKLTLLEKGLVLSSLSFLAIESLRRKRKNAVVHASIKVEDIKEQADYLHGNGEMEKLYEFLTQYKDSEDPEILWRFARACREISQLGNITPDEKKRVVYESHDFAKKALEKDGLCWAAHKWYGICLSDVGEYEGIKVKIGNAYKIRDHFQRAIELNPKDATTIHLIGLWIYMFADMPWYQKKIASTLFAATPSVQYDEALEYFQKAEEAEPNFYSKNHLYLGKTYLKLKNKELAVYWLTKAKDYPARTEEDQQVHKEAADILKSLGK
ncbi:regulator of microtubule dynamics protein 1 [Spea bombifrons]|uniref:regulator of microtubule dynamics protein 1 n=1 Tax=Spea bombifrons TaxID=233779 RepID=UPI00234ADF78|nr:regulator of microtubule dynamics protein 1 [Spea bombifrons]